MPAADKRHTGAAGAAVFNLAEFIDRSEGDPGLAREVACIFSSCAPGYIEALSKAVTAGEAESAQQSAHKLKGAAANLALPLLAESARRIESLAGSGNLGKAALLLPVLEERLAEALAAVQQELISPRQ